MDLLKNLFKGDRIIWIIFLLLCFVSIIEVFSASSTLTYKSGDHWRPITMHMLLLTVGALVVFIVHNIPVKLYKSIYAILLLPVSWIMLIFVLIMGEVTNSAKRWIDLGFIQFQPSELAKMGTIIVVALILWKTQSEKEKGEADPKAMKYILGITGISCILIFTENLSTALLLCISVYLMMFVGRVPWKQMLKLTAVCVGLVACGYLTIKYIPTEQFRETKLERIITWQSRLNSSSDITNVPPEKYDLENNVQTTQANIAIAGGGFMGKGPGNSVQRDFLPQAYSDFIYAIIIEELGLVGGAVVAFLYIWLLMRIGKIVQNCDSSYYAYLIMGIGILLTCQALMNMLVAVGLMPVTGQPLPLISRGGTSILVNCTYIGIILGVSRYANELKAEKEKEEAEKQQQVQEAAINVLKAAAEIVKQDNNNEQAEQLEK